MNPYVVVKISNIISRPELNGQLGIILTPQENEGVDEKLRCKVLVNECYISLKKSCLNPIEKGSIDWSVGDDPKFGPLDILSMALKTKFGLMDVCHEYVDSIIQFLSQTGQNFVPKFQFNKDKETQIMGNLNIHAVYALHFDYIGHNFILEVYQGRARVFMSYVINDSYGFTGKEWASPYPQKKWTSGLKKAHQKWGAGRELTMLELKELLDLLFELQETSERISDYLYSYAISPELRQKDEDFFSNKNSNDLSPLIKWCNHIRDNIGGVTIYYPSNDSDLHITTNGNYDIEKFFFSIPHSIYFPFYKKYQMLTGHFPDAITYFYTLIFRKWRTIYTPTNDDLHKYDAVGWTISLMSIPKDK